MRQPTTEECQRNQRTIVDGKNAMAAWYPQMGGYLSVCWVFPSPNGNCFDVAVFHDGDFPFAPDNTSPIWLHHCRPEHFISFGQEVRGWLANERTWWDSE